MARRRPKMPPRIRREVYKRDNYACRTCGWSPGVPPADYDGKNALYEVIGIRGPHETWPGEEIHRLLVVDHIHPISAGGAFSDPDNLHSLCGPCSGKKGATV
jgi:5-methylcytosine-specific restriction endonuclease McrA